jgi:DNA repair exonuclease SbcCD ATPase subunit
MNKTKYNFIAGLAMLGLETKAQDVLAKEFKQQLKSAIKAQEAVDKVEEIAETYNTLSSNLKVQKEMLETEVSQLKESINSLEISSDIVAKVMEINKQIEAKEAEIKAVSSAQLALGVKAKADTMDVLADAYAVVNVLTGELSKLIEEVKPVISGSNKAQIVKALQAIQHETQGYVYNLDSVANSLNVAKVTHKGVRFGISMLGITSAMASIEKL